MTTLHYADSLNTPRDNNFRLAYAKTYKLQPDVYAVQATTRRRCSASAWPP